MIKLLICILLTLIANVGLAWFDPVVGSKNLIYITCCNAFDTLSTNYNYDVGDTNQVITTRSGGYSATNAFRVGVPIQLLVKIETDLSATFKHAKLEYFEGTNTGESTTWNTINTFTDLTDAEGIEGAHFGLITWYPPKTNVYYLLRVSALVERDAHWYYTPIGAGFGQSGSTNSAVTNIDCNGGLGWPDWTVLGIQTTTSRWSYIQVGIPPDTNTISVPPMTCVTNLAASQGADPNEVVLTWSHPTTHDIYRTRTRRGNYKLADTTNVYQYDDMTMLPGTPYYYWISTTSGPPAEGWGTLSAPSGNTTPYCSKAEYTNMIRVSWNPVNLATSYIVSRYYGTDTPGVTPDFVTNIPVVYYHGLYYDDVNVSPYVHYTYTVQPTNDYGPGTLGGYDYGFCVSKIKGSAWITGEGITWYVIDPMPYIAPVTLHWQATPETASHVTSARINMHKFGTVDGWPETWFGPLDLAYPTVTSYDFGTAWRYAGADWSVQLFGTYPLENSETYSVHKSPYAR